MFLTALWHFGLNMNFHFSSIAQSCLTLCDPMDSSTPGPPVHHQLPESTQTPVHWVGDAIPLLLLLPSIFPSIRVFSNESDLHIRWPKYWSFSFNISPSNEYSGLISFRIDWLDPLAVQGIVKSLLQHHSSKAYFKSMIGVWARPTCWSLKGSWRGVGCSSLWGHRHWWQTYSRTLNCLNT